MYKYARLINHILDDGDRKRSTRGGVDTIGVFNYNYEHNYADGVPLLTTKKISWKNIVVENLWFLSGEPTVDFLHKHNVHFWDPWVQETMYTVPTRNLVGQDPCGRNEYEITYERHKHNTVPSAYGNFWRRFKTPGGGSVDQVRWAMETLKKNPMSRQVCITSWDPNNVMHSGLPPCHVMHVLNIQADGRLNLHLTQRSCDSGLGLPYNMAGYGGFLLPLYARFLDVEPGVFAHSIVDMHIYTDNEKHTMAEYDHVPALTEQIAREPRALPTLKIDESVRCLDDLEHIVKSDMSTEQIMDLFKLEGYDPWPAVKMKVAV